MSSLFFIRLFQLISPHVSFYISNLKSMNVLPAFNSTTCVFGFIWGQLLKTSRAFPSLYFKVTWVTLKDSATFSCVWCRCSGVWAEVKTCKNNAFVCCLITLRGKLSQFPTGFASLQCGKHMQMLSFSLGFLHHMSPDNRDLHIEKMPADVITVHRVCWGCSAPSDTRATYGFSVTPHHLPALK